jgi:disulfide bond formation protein DsbB
MRFISIPSRRFGAKDNGAAPLAPWRARVHIAAMHVLSYRSAGLIAALAAALALVIAHSSERWEGLVPCALCLWERWPYRVAILLGVAAAFLPRKAARVAMALLTLAILSDAVLAFVHAGVEYHWWPSPLPECAAPSFGGGSIAERLARMPATPAKPCDSPSYLIPGLPISMVEMNLIFACVFTAASAWVVIRKQSR